MNKKLEKLIILSIVAVVFTGCVRHEPQFLPANYFYQGSYIDVHSPNQEGWSLLDKSNSQILFGKKGIKYNESYIARVVFFPLKPTKNRKDFFNLIKIQASKSSNKERFTEVESSFKLSKQRSYPCVIAKEVFEDKMAKTSKGNRENLLMQVKSLYCKDPKREEAGFMIGYSYRGESINSNFNLEADSFINGVKFPKK